MANIDDPISISNVNSSDTPLGANQTFSGTFETVLDYAEIDLVASGSAATAAPGTLYFDFSSNGTWVDVSVPITVYDINSGIVPVPLRTVLPFFRVRYINGTVAQTVFHLRTVYHRDSSIRLTRFLNQTLTDSEPIEVVAAVLKTKDTSGNYSDLNLDSSGALIVTNTGISGTPVNVYAENATVPSSVLTAILSYTVPAGKTLSITGAYGWGQADGEFTIKVDSVIVGGGWSSPSFRTLHLDYTSASILANAGQVVTVNVTQYYASTQDFKANLLGTLN